MTRCRAITTPAVTMLGIAAYTVGGTIWLVGVAPLVVAHVILLASQLTACSRKSQQRPE